MKIGNHTTPRRKFFLQVNDIIRFEGMVYRIEYVYTGTPNVILHNMETGIKMPQMIKEHQVTILCSKRLKSDLKRTVRITNSISHRFKTSSSKSANSKQEQQEIPSPPVNTVSQLTDTSSSEASPTTVLIKDTYIEEKEKSIPVEEKKSQSYIPSISNYCSIM